MIHIMHVYWCLNSSQNCFYEEKNTKTHLQGLISEMGVYTIALWMHPYVGTIDMFYLTMHSTCFIYSYMASDIW